MHLMIAYLKEREGFECLAVEEGFALYKITGEECYIRDIYVRRDFRNKGIASRLADDIAQIAKKADCKYLLGTVMPSAAYSTDSVKVLLAYGFRLHASIQDGILFRKDL